MLKLIRPETIELAVTVSPPNHEAPVNITIQIRYLDVQERIDYLAKVAKKGLTDLAIVDDLVVGWSGVSDANGEVLKFSSQAAKSAFRLDYLFFPLRDALLNELQMEQAARKN